MFVFSNCFVADRESWLVNVKLLTRTGLERLDRPLRRRDAGCGMQRMRRLRTTQARLCPSICAAGLLLLIRAAGKALFSELLGDGKSY